MRMEKTVKERIIEFANAKQITVRDFERCSGLSNGYVNAIRKGLGSEKLSNVLTAFPDLNRDWLLYGEGPMLASDDSAPPPSSAINGSHSSQAVGAGARAVNGEGVKECLEIMKQQQESISKLVETVNRLTKIISER